jgi:2-furoyl-CoA dehydrogenase large subunit
LGAESVGYSDGYFYDTRDGSRRVDLRRLAAAVQWDPGSLPEGLDANLSVTVYYQPTTVKAPQGDRLNSSATYAVQAHLAVVEVDRETGEVRVLRYVVSHDSGRIFRREFVDSVMMGSILQGIGMVLHEELGYSDDGEPLVTTFDAYESPTLSDALGIDIELVHFETVARHLLSGAHGVGEGPIMGVPAALLNAVSNALGRPINELPLRPWVIA